MFFIMLLVDYTGFTLHHVIQASTETHHMAII